MDRASIIGLARNVFSSDKPGRLECRLLSPEMRLDILLLKWHKVTPSDWPGRLLPASSS